MRTNTGELLKRYRDVYLSMRMEHLRALVSGEALDRGYGTLVVQVSELAEALPAGYAADVSAAIDEYFPRTEDV